MMPDVAVLHPRDLVLDAWDMPTPGPTGWRAECFPHSQADLEVAFDGHREGRLVTAVLIMAEQREGDQLVYVGDCFVRTVDMSVTHATTVSVVGSGALVTRVLHLRSRNTGPRVTA